MKEDIITFAHGVKRIYAPHLVEHLAELYGKYYKKKCVPPNALLLPCSMLEALKAAHRPSYSAFGNPHSDRFMDCEVVAIDELDCKDADYVPRFFRRCNPKSGVKK